MLVSSHAQFSKNIILAFAIAPTDNQKLLSDKAHHQYKPMVISFVLTLQSQGEGRHVMSAF